METASVNWQRWQQFFEHRRNKKLPELEAPESYSDVPASVAKSLAIFQLGESGGGTICQQARNSPIEAIDSNYADAMQLFVNEEHRHAEVLAICVRNLGGSLIRHNWTARVFVFARRLIGLRLKVLVLLAAEVVGICYYHLLATRLPGTRMQTLLVQLVDDERSHLHFHCSFLRTQVTSSWKRVLFILVWRITMLAAAVVVMLDHRQALRDLELSPSTVWRRWMAYSSVAERLVAENQIGREVDCVILGSQPAAASG
jgi:hypothetical protein